MQYPQFIDWNIARKIGLLPASSSASMSLEEWFQTVQGSGGAAQVGFLQSGTGATARTAQAKLREWVSVLDMGADNTGTNDSATAFSDAVAGGYALVPPGTYKLSSSPTAGTWFLLPGVTLTGAGSLTGNQVILNETSSSFPWQLISNATTNSQIITHRVEAGFYQTAASVSANSFGQTIEAWTPSTNTTNYTAALTGAYGSFSHFGSGTLANGYGGAFEGFNSGSATATLIVGVEGTANNGGVSAGVPSQTPSNNGAATNLRAIDGLVKNISTGVVANAAIFYGEAPVNSGGGSITNLYGLYLNPITEGGTNYAIYTQAGLVRFGDAVSATGGFKSTLETNGYSTGAGGTITQLTSKSTAVTLNASCGTVVMNNASLGAGTAVTFTLNNSKINGTCVLATSIFTGATTGAYTVTVENIQVGLCQITLRNNSGGALAEAVTIAFAVIQVATS